MFKSLVVRPSSPFRWDSLYRFSSSFYGEMGGFHTYTQPQNASFSMSRNHLLHLDSLVLRNLPPCQSVSCRQIQQLIDCKIVQSCALIGVSRSISKLESWKMLKPNVPHAPKKMVFRVWLLTNLSMTCGEFDEIYIH